MFSGIRKLFGQILKVLIIYLVVTETIIFTIPSRIRIKLKISLAYNFAKHIYCLHQKVSRDIFSKILVQPDSKDLENRALWPVVLRD